MISSLPMPIIRAVQLDEITQTAQSAAREILALDIPQGKNLHVLIGEGHNQIAQVIFQTEFAKEFHKHAPDTVFCDEGGALAEELPTWKSSSRDNPLGYVHDIWHASRLNSSASALRYAVVTDANISYLPSPDLKCEIEEEQEYRILENFSPQVLEHIASNSYFASVAAKYPSITKPLHLYARSEEGIIARDMEMATNIHAAKRSTAVVGRHHLASPEFSSRPSLPMFLSSLGDIVATIGLHVTTHNINDFGAFVDMSAAMQEIAPGSHALHLDFLLPYTDAAYNRCGDGVCYFLTLSENQKRAPV